MTLSDLPGSPQAIMMNDDNTQWPKDGTATIASQLKSGFNHAVSAMWQADRQLHKVIFSSSIIPYLRIIY